ncbi:MAG: transcription-repair coupling factor [Candidatus Marinimicrobia bacterium]|nr:transcription-repair coupling factor [Candidatus Neomarinimicrobiota bacterium]
MAPVFEGINLIEELIGKDEASKSFAEKAALGGRYKVSGLSGSLTAFLAKSTFKSTGRSLLIAAESLKRAEAYRDDLETLLGKEFVYFFPESGKSIGQESITIQAFQSHALQGLLGGDHTLIISTFRGLLEMVPPLGDLIKNRIQLNAGDEIEIETLISRLTNIGYEREKMVSRPFEFSVRGGILDIFPISSEYPVRIDFFDDTIDSIREFDIITQRSHKHIINSMISPDFFVENLWQGASQNLVSVIPPDTIIWIDGYDRLAQIADDDSNIDLDEIKNKIQGSDGADILSVSSPRSIRFNSSPQTRYRSSIGALSKDLHKWETNKDFVFILCENDFHQERLSKTLDNDGTAIETAPLSAGFNLPSVNLRVLTDHEIFDRTRKRRSFNRFVSHGTPVRDSAGIQIGDFLVHIDHGIGEYRGMEKIKISGAMRECLKILYAGGDKIYLPVENFRRIQKYKAGEGIVPKLNKLGSNEWEKIKKRTRSSTDKIARDLVELYAKRLSSKGFSFAPDIDMQWALEASFPFDETPDQLRAVDEVKADMEKEYPMDRLLCGDVGFGKTEVALRAAFKCALSGKQTSLLVPTTILAEQHYQTFRERLEPFPVIVESLSRFKSKKEQTEILKQLESGKVDILIGTHRILSADVKFKDLGLLIIDEEHRFGVRQKESLKNLRISVDTLSMTATPIPRTLNFSLLGARDLSNINTAPKNRLPIYTEITTLDEGVVRDAVMREVERNGQIYFVHNEIKSINRIYEKLRRWVPHVRICIAHGQMKPKELESIMSDFMGRKYELLLSTMIIESGLDIPNVNTILINRADRFGLSQLYQLRGRVGRSDKRAFAYLLIPPIHKLGSNAISRLNTLENFSHLGAGFSIAMQDLEIRGAGNLLGTQQSGFMEAVGFDMYNRLVAEAVDKIKEEFGIKQLSVQGVETEISCDLDAYLPDSYILDGEVRVDFYKRLASLTEMSELEDIREELSDRYGSIPQEAKNLLDITEIKIISSKLRIRSLKIKRSEISGLLGDYEKVSPEDIFFKSLSTSDGLDKYDLTIDSANGVSFRAKLSDKNKLKSAKTLLNSLSP